MNKSKRCDGIVIKLKIEDVDYNYRSRNLYLKQFGVIFKSVGINEIKNIRCDKKLLKITISTYNSNIKIFYMNKKDCLDDYDFMKNRNFGIYN